ncbi:hypothetical protein [Legionella spiritensis]|uniref:Uncharacterized protein n=1 Tax=Legionella spiritensis TaxID=452 RepID=A0A0W0Z052_LEGSP|nr:hypothetical protein [Legionella spiritensis]KTD62517.1 hypothetical protein Lspi_1729 [Legionella spiritensis]SNV30862.1 Uncharacterised protein [Legionella spiritensis]
MGWVKKSCFNWLIDKHGRDKALLKFEIRQLEARLHRMFNDGDLPDCERRRFAACCTELAGRYAELLQIHTSSWPSCDFDNDLKQYATAESCYEELLIRKRQWLSASSNEEEARIISDIGGFYKKIAALSQAATPFCETKNMEASQGLFKAVVQSTTPDIWLMALIHFANQTGQESEALPIQLARLNNEQLTRCNEQITRPEFVSLINTIFFYKIHPDKLYDFSLHPEKIISVKSRLVFLHHFIEYFQRNIVQNLGQRGLKSGQDYLLHDDELPEGIQVEPDKTYRGLIGNAIKEGRFVSAHHSDHTLYQNRLLDLFRAYKFWFNPDRLIDTAMSLQKSLAGDGVCHENDKIVTQRLCVLYKPLPTTECLNLYGYFANKDSTYLLRTLQAAFLGHAITNCPDLDPQEKETARQVYNALTGVMDALREELANRGIVTANYQRHDGMKKVRPGRRNLNALHRILIVYNEKSFLENDRISQLFKEVEG